MIRNREHAINRKEFLRRSTGSLLGLGVAGLSSSVFTGKTHASQKTEYRTLGRTGLRVTAVGFGATRTDQPGVMKKVIDMGVNFIDTGRHYDSGRNEEMIGRVIKGIRHNIIIQSKIHRRIRTDRKKIEECINGSLKALQTDYIDIVLLHMVRSPEDLNNEDSLEGLVRAKESGKIRFCGFSSHNDHLGNFDVAIKSGFYDVAMAPYNHAGNYTHSVSKTYNEWDQPALEKKFNEAVAIGMGIIAMKTCSAGPYKADGESEPSFKSALKWILRNRNISATVPGMGNFREVEEDVQAMWG